MSQERPRQSSAEYSPDIKLEIDIDSSSSIANSLSKSNLDRHIGHTHSSHNANCQSQHQQTSEWIQQHAINPLETHQTVSADLFWGQSFSSNSIRQVEPRDAFRPEAGIFGTLSRIQHPLPIRILTGSENIISRGIASTSGSSSTDDAWTSHSSGDSAGTISLEDSLLPFTSIQDPSPPQGVGFEDPPQSTASSSQMSVRSPVTGSESVTDYSTIPWEISNLRADIRQLRDEVRNLNNSVQHLNATPRLLPEPVIDQRGRRHAFAIPSVLEDYTSEPTLNLDSSDIEHRDGAAENRNGLFVQMRLNITVDLSMRPRTASEEIIGAGSRQESALVFLSAHVTTGQLQHSHATTDEIVIECELSSTQTEGEY